MRPPNAKTTLAAWERGRGAPFLERSLHYLVVADPTFEAARHGLGEVQQRLVDLRKSIFGDRVEGVVDCPGCGCRLEIEFPLADRGDSDVEPQGSLQVVAGGWEIRFRSPTVAAAVAAAKTGSIDDARRVLLEDCVEQARFEGRVRQAVEIPVDLCREIERRLAEADPDVNVALDMKCDSCCHGWQIDFDIASFLATEIDQWARRTFVEIDTLARRYGWSEREILRLSPARRRTYVELAGQ